MKTIEECSLEELIEIFENNTELREIKNAILLVLALHKVELETKDSELKVYKDALRSIRDTITETSDGIHKPEFVIENISEIVKVFKNEI